MRIIKKEVFKTGLCIALFVAVLVGLFAPLDFYMTNKAYFSFDGMDVVPFSVLITMSLVLGGGCVVAAISVIPKKIAMILEGLVLGSFVSLYIIGNFMVVNYGAMDGLIVHWEKYRTEGIMQVGCCIIVVIFMVSLSIFAGDKALKIYRYVSLFLMGVLLFTLCVSILTIGTKKDAEYITTDEKQFDLSADKNVIVLIVDTFDSGIFADMLSEDYNRYSSIVEDFVYYPDTSAMYAATDLALPHIVTGEKYYNEKTYGEYLNTAYEKSPLLDKIREEKYAFGLYTTCRMPQDDDVFKADNVRCIKRTVSSHRKLAGYLYKFIAFRYLPQPFKQYFWFYPEEMTSDIECTVDEDIHMYYDNNYLFYDGVSEINAEADEKTVKIYHIDGVHAPFSINSDFSPSDVETSIEDEGRGIFVMIDYFLDELKKKGIYDNSAIIIMSDHGYYNKRSNALFLAKGIGERHPFIIDDKENSFEYLQNIIINLMDGAYAEKAVGTCADATKGRKFLFYSWDKDLRDDSFADCITEYRIDGSLDREESYSVVNYYEAEDEQE